MAFLLPIFVLSQYLILTIPNPGESVTTSYFVIQKIYQLLYPIQNIVTFHYLLQKDDISKAVRQSISRISTLLRLRLPDDNESLAQNTTINAQPVSEWVKDDVYDSNNRESTMRTVNIGQDPEGGNEQNTKSMWKKMKN